MIPPASDLVDEAAAKQPLPPGPAADYACEALRLNGISLSNTDLELTIAEFERALEIARALIEHSLPDGLDQAGVYRP
jgi:hypothetical protein